MIILCSCSECLPHDWSVVGLNLDQVTKKTVKIAPIVSLLLFGVGLVEVTAPQFQGAVPLLATIPSGVGSRCANQWAFFSINLVRHLRSTLPKYQFAQLSILWKLVVTTLNIFCNCQT